ncbi:electron transport complex subunit RsxC [Glaciecola punicea]|uniref:electron transport complex subunit RsxC n=1 Tax=Glaciecola punicea TaxID=56804 RepID=UPI0008726818|nr:electron transport complex subunit RsxC [Glaciecola punicea]OFA31587.1 electron transport complex subunit RsxC [Glaciecola punicea]
MKGFASFDTVLERLSVGRLWDFPGGVHPAQEKSLSNKEVIKNLPLPEYVYVPIKQHIGVDSELLVTLGDKVLKGQALTASENPYAVPVHASSSGLITAIGEHPAAHPSGLPEMTVTITLDGKDDAIATQGISQYKEASKHDIISAICNAGISGLGGAGFPTHIKSNTIKPVEFLIINGIECEPYISADDRLMREHAWQIRQGIDILHHLIKPKRVIIAIEDNKPEALETMSIACQQQSEYHVVSVPTKYPAGGERQLIQVLTSREVPSDGLPIDIGCVMYNVGTCFAVADAIIEGKALTQRVVTVTGKAIDKPQNVWAKIGTPVSHLLENSAFDVNKQAYPRIIMGGPMMGFTLASAKIPIVKITNCILAPAAKELPSVEDERGCIRCSACADACPVSLLPQQLFWYSKAKDYDVAQEYDLFDCIECGACAYVCPSEIPLVHYYRQAKGDIRAQLHEKEQAEKARIRFEARQQRLESEKQAREEKHRLAAQARTKALNSNGGAKDKIAAALARAKAKKSAQLQPSEDSVNDGASVNANKVKLSPSETASATKAEAKND